jgi:hypothetical protein
VNPTLLKLAKTACLVEYNSGDYTTYLTRIFSGNPDFAEAIVEWGADERRHGLALKRWAEMCDPEFNFDNALKRFTSSYRVPMEVDESVRGSLGKELVARCIVESGTSSYYAALSDASDEPVFKQICKLISIDEIHHYNLFFKFLKQYIPRENLSVWQRTKVALSRCIEVSDEEMSFAYVASNKPNEEISKANLKSYSSEFMSLTYGLYQYKHMRSALKLIWRAAGLDRFSWLEQPLAATIYKMLQRKAEYVRRQELSSGLAGK